MTNLYSQNTPWSFWLCEPDPPREAWLEACRNAIPVIGMSHQVEDIDTAIALTLGDKPIRPEGEDDNTAPASPKSTSEEDTGTDEGDTDTE